MSTTVYIFAGTFRSNESAVDYSEERWLPAPSDTASAEEYAQWEAANPTWALRDDLGVDYLDGDFIETLIDREHWWEYLRGLLRDELALKQIQAAVEDASTLVLIFEQALAGQQVELGSTPRLELCGAFPAYL